MAQPRVPGYRYKVTFYAKMTHEYAANDMRQMVQEAFRRRLAGIVGSHTLASIQVEALGEVTAEQDDLDEAAAVAENL